MSSPASQPTDSQFAYDRLVHLFNNEPERRICWLTGAGISLGVIDSTDAMIKRFLLALPAYADRIEAVQNTAGSAAAYQLAAEYIVKTKGAAALQKVIDEAATSRAAFQDTGAQPRTVKNAIDRRNQLTWPSTPPQETIARITRELPLERRGVIFTTNFDTLTESTLGKHGIQSTPLNLVDNRGVNFRTNFTNDNMKVAHLHGVWGMQGGIHTTANISRERSELIHDIQGELRDSTLIVIGYSGWDDVMMMTLANMAENSFFSENNTEVLWLAHSPSRSQDSAERIAILRECPSVTFYHGIDALAEFSTIPRALKIDRGDPSLTHLRGWHHPPLMMESRSTDSAPPHFAEYCDGAEPNWLDASIAPNLSFSTECYRRITEYAISTSLDSILLLTGPTGEGKSTALRQCAMMLANEIGRERIYWHEPGAPMLGASEIDTMRSEEHKETVFVFVDDADLVWSDILRNCGRPGNKSSLVWVFCAHEAYERDLQNDVVLSGLQLDVFRVSAPTDDDWNAIVESWIDNSVVPGRFSTYEKSHAQSELMRVAEKSSLFGAMLSVRSGKDLINRVDDLLRKLEHRPVGSLTFRKVLEIVALYQCAYKDEAKFISVSSLASAAAISSSDVLQMIIKPLGREVGIIYDGLSVCVRHSKIADTIDSIAKKTAEASNIAFILGKTSGDIIMSDSGYDRDLELLRRKLRPYSLAVRFAESLTDHSDSMLSSHVGLVATLRQAGEHERALEHANSCLSVMNKYRDSHSAWRGLYIEYGYLMLAEGQLYDALSYAFQSLADRDSTPVKRSNIAYSFTLLKKVAGRLRSAGGMDDVERLSLVASELSAFVEGNRSMSQKECDGLIDDFIAIANSRVRVGASNTLLTFDAARRRIHSCRKG
ncbi:SIR2 family protein [Actinomyces procaprae]|uniref:P-loop NTPase n=1 Tax=Actinomyces procaprae TaxID=2560010 RepID=UPI00109E2FCA|nr:SIR2 family protein [Actinomyces procaprae]